MGGRRQALSAAASLGSGVSCPPILRRNRCFAPAPQPPPGCPRGRFGGHQILVGSKPAEHPGQALRHEFLVHVAVVDPKRTQQPLILINCHALDSHRTAFEFGGQRPPGGVAVGLAILRRVDPLEPDPPGLPPFVEAGDRVAVVNGLDPPQRPADRISQWTHGN